MADGHKNNPLATFEFASTADKWFDMDWTEWLEGATIASAAVTANASTLVETHDLDATVNGSTLTRFWVRGLDNGIGQAFVTVTVTATDGRTDAYSYLYNVNAPGA